MSEEVKEIEVFESRRFSKALSKLSDHQLKVVEDHIEKIIEDPNLGEQKKGDLSHVRVYKFKLDNQLALLGYSYVQGQLQLYLLNLASHENFYRDMKKQRKSDLNLIK